MTRRVAINGFGRVGRLAVRAAWGFDPRLSGSLEHPAGPWGDGRYEIVHVNETGADAAAIAHLLTHDSVHGRWPVPVGADDGGFRIAGRRVGVSRNSAITRTDWAGLGIDIVIEATGAFRSPPISRPASMPGWGQSWWRARCTTAVRSTS